MCSSSASPPAPPPALMPDAHTHLLAKLFVCTTALLVPFDFSCFDSICLCITLPSHCCSTLGRGDQTLLSTRIGQFLFFLSHLPWLSRWLPSINGHKQTISHSHSLSRFDNLNGAAMPLLLKWSFALFALITGTITLSCRISFSPSRTQSRPPKSFCQCILPFEQCLNAFCSFSRSAAAFVVVKSWWWRRPRQQKPQI